MTALRTHSFEEGDRVETKAMTGTVDSGGPRYGEIVGVQEDSDFITVLWDDTHQDSRVMSSFLRMEQP